jgi:DNA-binding transcriptional LysR family regulator
LSQSGLSRRLNELERRCGCKLFTRDHAHVAITDAGRAFMEEAKLSILHSESAVSEEGERRRNLALDDRAFPLRRPHVDFNALFHSPTSASQPAS